MTMMMVMMMMDLPKYDFPPFGHCRFETLNTQKTVQKYLKSICTKAFERNTHKYLSVLCIGVKFHCWVQSKLPNRDVFCNVFANSLNSGSYLMAFLAIPF